MIHNGGEFGFNSYHEHRTHTKWGRVVAIILAILAALLISRALMAQVLMQTGPLVCYPADKVADDLLNDAKEQVVMQGVTVMGQVLKVYATADGSTWTAVLILPMGDWSCTIAAGNSLEANLSELENVTRD